MSGRAPAGRSAEHLAQRLVAIRRELHRHPELAHEEFETTARIRGWLEAAGIRIADRYALRTGVIAEVGGLREGPVVALRADIDALPVQEETGLPFASEVPGRMHACGHDFHTAAIIGAALLLKEREADLRGTVRLIPLEEVRYLQAEEKYVVVHHARGEDLIEESLRSLEEEFGDRFVRIHRNCLVAREELVELRRDGGGHVQAILRHGDRPLEVSRRCVPQLRQALGLR